jgi:hypothetical protein
MSAEPHNMPQKAVLENIEMPWLVQSVNRGTSRIQPSSATAPAMMAYAAAQIATTKGALVKEAGRIFLRIARWAGDNARE